MASMAGFASFDEWNEPLLGRYYRSSEISRKDRKGDQKRLLGAGDEVATSSGCGREAHDHGWGFERRVAGNAHDLADSHLHKNHARVQRLSVVEEGAPVPAAIETEWLYEPCNWARERGRIQEGAPDTGNASGYERPSKHAFTPEFLSKRPPDWGNWRIPHRPQHPSWQLGEEADFLPLNKPLSLPDPRLIIGNSPPSPSRSPGIRAYNTYQASTPPDLYRSNPTQPSPDQQPNCGKSLETMEVEAAFILMLIRHETPEAAAVAISRELRLAQEERQFRRAVSPCGSEDTIVGSEFDEEER
ncbi:hypothetical protein KC343_g704 [Hortaea werneckii]|nr:hypothetical protein KC352_g6310 [Hortaea werneckii]KAI7572489.1 hypothetical protein KC317_g713 [Hortaea werneckii]KAI7604321.1 hypothetical protein KC346_g11513 [Hortaea werneckii]KAI7637461.1 hypothetical protein KC343_g704 [Hortaea werneckii]KAI7683187.1 hypothetical protein KC319_g588 [Hortaea werneckii]